MSDLTDFFPLGGGGSTVNSFGLQPGAQGSDKFTDENDDVWLRTGVVETDRTVYPLLTGSIFLANPAHVYYVTNFNGGYSQFGMEYDFLNNVAVIRSGNTQNWPYSSVKIADVGADGLPDGTVSSASFGTSMFKSTPLSDGTDNWICMYNGTEQVWTGPRYSGYQSPGFTVDDFIFKKATGGTYGSYTYEATGIALSGYTDNPSYPNGNLLYPLECSQVISGIAVDNNYFYLGVYSTTTSYCNYNQSSRSMSTTYNVATDGFYGIQTMKFDKNTGVWVENLPAVWPINRKNGIALMSIPNPGASTTLSVGNNQAITAFDNNGDGEGSGSIDLYAEGLRNITKCYFDHNDNLIVWYGTNSSGPINIYQLASGFTPSIFSRGITTSLSSTQTGSGPIGPSQTSEHLGEPVYIKAT
tara:strand:- start:233 stop:1471 length:1239 start_codon:yes stop_codon:yes gene_type:complete